jgi:CHAT domain
MADRAFFLLGFTYNQNDQLPGVVDELNALSNVLNDTAAEVRPLWGVNQKTLESNLLQKQKVLRIFHYSGHAGSEFVELNDGIGKTKIAYSDGLADMLGAAKAIKLVFLNGCSTEAQTEALLKVGIPVVIATTQPLSDQLGLEFARRFYESFTDANSELTLQEAFNFAIGSFKTAHGKLKPEMFDERVRGNFKPDDAVLKQPVYKMKINPNKPGVADEVFTTWLDMSNFVDNSKEKKRIQDLIAAGRTEDALAALVAGMNNNDARQVKNNYETAKKENLLGLIDSKEWFQRQAIAANAVLKLLDMW